MSHDVCVPYFKLDVQLMPFELYLVLVIYGLICGHVNENTNPHIRAIAAAILIRFHLLTNANTISNDMIYLLKNTIKG